MEFINEVILNKLLPRLRELLKDNTSFSKRTTAIYFVSSLASVKDVAKLQPFVGNEFFTYWWKDFSCESRFNQIIILGKLLSALLKSLSDGDKSIRQISAQVIGKLCKAAKESCIDNLMIKLMQLIVKNASKFQVINNYDLFLVLIAFLKIW